jgi:pimeloyl-ACP methyl ester carboxylesterase
MTRIDDEEFDRDDEGRITWLDHSKTRLAVHLLAEGEGAPLLMLHGLGESSAGTRLAEVSSWPGPIHGLDFTGHGRSTGSQGGGYTCELLMADVDAALAVLGPVTLYGRGLGAYIALLTAGGRPDLVRGAILCDGPGLAGGGPNPTGPMIPHPDPQAVSPPDPYALVELARDLRPSDYASEFVRQALEHSKVDPPIVVCAAEAPEWLQSIAEIPGIHRTSPSRALTLYRDRLHPHL